jgi:hypothetical protein
MVLGCVPFKIVSDRPALHSRWLLLLKIEISSIVHCCFIIPLRKHSLVGYIGICLSVYPSVGLSGPTSTSFVRFPPNFVEFKIMMCELCSIKDLIVHWVLPLLCLFGLRHFETIQYALCHCKFSYRINQKLMKLCTLQDPNMKMCTLVGYPSPLSFTPVMLLWTWEILRQFTMHFAIGLPHA